MKRFTWVLTLCVCAILGALSILASCESDGVPAPDPTDDYPLCEGKSDSPGCPLVLPDEDTVSSTDTTEGAKPDTDEPPDEPQKPNDYEGEKCPNLGCVLHAPADDESNKWDCGEPPDFPPDSLVITGLPTSSVPAGTASSSRPKAGR